MAALFCDQREAGPFFDPETASLVLLFGGDFAEEDFSSSCVGFYS
jgi:hypothetical protein